MRILLSLGALVVLCSSASAQTTSSFLNNGGKNTGLAAVSSANPWIGSQVAYRFGGTGDFADNLLVSARLLYEIEFEVTKSDNSKGASRFRLPVMGNFASLKLDPSSSATLDEETKSKLQELLLSSQGIHVGLYPVFTAVDKPNVIVNLHGALSWKLNGFEQAAGQDVVYVNQARFSAGIEAGIGKRGDGKQAFWVSVAPTVAVFSKDSYAKVFGEAKSSIKSVEVSAIIPIGGGLGVVLENVFAKSPSSTFRAGLVVAAALK